MKVKLEIRLVEDKKEQYGYSDTVHLQFAKELILPLPTKQFQLRVLGALNEMREELDMAFNRLAEAERVAAEKAAEAVETQ